MTATLSKGTTCDVTEQTDPQWCYVLVCTIIMTDYLLGFYVMKGEVANQNVQCNSSVRYHPNRIVVWCVHIHKVYVLNCACYI